MSRKQNRRLKAQVHFAKDHRGRRIPIPIREVRPGYYLVDVVHEGKRHRACFGSLEQAELHAVGKHNEIINYGLAVFSMTDAQRRDALTALETLGGRATLTAAAELWAKQHPANGAETIVTTCARYLQGMKKEGCRRISLKDKIWRFRKFIRFFGPDRLTAGLSTDDAEAFCREAGYKGTTERNYKRAFKNLLNFYAGAKKSKTQRDEKLPETWPAATVEKIMRTAEKHHPEALPGLAVLFFCGLRPHEAFGLQWEAVDLSGGEISVSPEISKLRSARHVTIAPNALKWLAAHRKRSGHVCVGGIYAFRRLREIVMREAGVKRWPVDVSRHTFATAHFMAHGDAALTMKELGHFGSADTFVRHYKGHLSKREAERFWKIEPTGKGNVIRMTA